MESSEPAEEEYAGDKNRRLASAERRFSTRRSPSEGERLGHSVESARSLRVHEDRLPGSVPDLKGGFPRSPRAKRVKRSVM